MWAGKTAWYTLCKFSPKSRRTKTDTSVYYPYKSTMAMTTAHVTKDRQFTDALSYALSHIGLSSIALKQEQLTAIHYLYQRKTSFCGYRLVSGSRSATRCCHSFLTSLEVCLSALFFDGLSNSCTCTAANRRHPQFAQTVAD